MTNMQTSEIITGLLETVSRYSVTQLLDYSATQVLGYSATRVLGCSSTRVLRYLATRLLVYLGTLVLGYSGTRLLVYSGTQVLGYSSTRVLRYSPTRLLGYSATRLLGYSRWCHGSASRCPSARRRRPGPYRSSRHTSGRAVPPLAGTPPACRRPTAPRCSCCWSERTYPSNKLRSLWRLGNTSCSVMMLF